MAAEPIYGLMITGKTPLHREFAARAAANFFAQTYPEKKLIVVNDGAYRMPDIFGGRLSEIRVEQKLKLGALRNISLDQVPEGALWVQWDDDDWRHPELLARQYGALAQENAAACVLRRQVRYAILQNSAWVENREYIEGTVMARSTKLRYRNLPKAEDTHFLRAYAAEHRVAKWDNPPRYYIRLIHGHNTWDAAHFRISERTADKWKVAKEARLCLETVAREYAFLKSAVD
jgi:glycosyltransferase involved in cell wall biosynthesis